jgi:predicted dinucleotide-binding enzyme
MTTAIVGVGEIGSTVARHLTAGGEPVVLAAKDPGRVRARADEIGPLARAASVEEAIREADTVVLALWLDTMRELIPQYEDLFRDKVVIDTSNPVAFDEKGQISRTLPTTQSAGSVVSGLLPAGAHYVKAFGTLGGESLAASAHHEPRAVLFYATDDETAASTVERLIRTAGFDPVKAGGLADAGRIEAPGGDLHQSSFNGELVNLAQATAAVRHRPAAGVW